MAACAKQRAVPSFNVGKGRGGVDERGFAVVRQLRGDPNLAPGTSLPEFKAMVREQSYLLLIDQEAVLAAIPNMLPQDLETRRLALDAVKRVLTAFGPLKGEDQQRLALITRLFDLTDVGAENVVPLATTTAVQSRAS